MERFHGTTLLTLSQHNWHSIPQPALQPSTLVTLVPADSIAGLVKPEVVVKPRGLGTLSCRRGEPLHDGVDRTGAATWGERSWGVLYVCSFESLSRLHEDGGSVGGTGDSLGGSRWGSMVVDGTDPPRGSRKSMGQEEELAEGQHYHNPFPSRDDTSTLRIDQRHFGHIRDAVVRHRDFTLRRSALGSTKNSFGADVQKGIRISETVVRRSSRPLAGECTGAGWKFLERAVGIDLDRQIAEGTIVPIDVMSGLQVLRESYSCTNFAEKKNETDLREVEHIVVVGKERLALAVARE